MQESFQKSPRSRKSKPEEGDYSAEEGPRSKRQRRAAREEKRNVVEITTGLPVERGVVPTKKEDVEAVQPIVAEEKATQVAEDLDFSTTAPVQSVAYQIRAEKTQKEFIKAGLLPKSARTTDVNVDRFHHAPQYAPEHMQEDMDALAVAKELEAEEQSAIDTRIKFARMADVPTLTDVVEPELQEEPQYAVWRRGESARRFEVFDPISGEAWQKSEPRDISLSSLGEPVVPIETEGTSLEEKNKFREFMARAGEKLRIERMKEYAARRLVELGEKAKEYGPGTESLFRSLGKNYNKLGWKTKIAVGAGLGVGAVVSAGVSLPLSLLFGTGLGVQRLAGMSSMFLKIEKYLQDHKESNVGMGPLRIREERIKEAALLGSVVYTVFMGTAITAGVQVASETEAAHAVQKWLGDVLGHHSAVPVAPEQAHPAPSQVASGSVASAPPPVPEAPEIPSAATAIEVKATPGKGYEYMMKRLWEQLHEKHVELPANANPESDLARLLAADKDSIDKVVHDIAADPKHQFFRADGSSVRIDEGAQMTIGARGELHLSSEKFDYQIAPPQAPVVPVPHPEVPAPPTEVPTPPGESIPRVDLVPPEPVGTIDLVSSPGEVLVPGPETVISNQFGITVHTNEAHLYADPSDQNFFAYGGSQEERVKTITEYLTKHPFKVVYAEDSAGHRVPWFRTIEGSITQGPPMRTNGFLGLFSSFLKPPTPDDFGKIIK